MNKLTSISKMIDHSLHHPTFTDGFLSTECITAKGLGVTRIGATATKEIIKEAIKRGYK